ncbi:MAG: helix-turn-helix transcriptional regulator [Chloroflexaceae bacterium]|nr:helix-turn-helix transcriptional regulator [Chloroflexaceae bacterium]NJO07402.1 helix-turn-helix transcriptional regulator [Chloroflexaceae bacterium]
MASLRVRELAQAQGYNISTLSRRADLSYPTVHAMWHSHVVRIDLTTLEAVARVLGVRTGDLIVDEQDEAGVSPLNKQRRGFAIV